MKERKSEVGGQRSEESDPTTGSERLRGAAARLVRMLRAQVDDPSPDDPEPSSEWGKRAEERLRKVEQTLANQNRLLLITLVTILGDAIAKVLTR